MQTLSEVVQLRQNIADEYRAAQLGLSGLAYGTSRHDFITAKMERIGIYHEQLQTCVGEDQAMGLVAQTLEALPATITGQTILDLLPRELGTNEATAHLTANLRTMWKTMDLLKDRLGNEQAQKFILAPIMLPVSHAQTLAPLPYPSTAKYPAVTQ